MITHMRLKHCGSLLNNTHNANQCHQNADPTQRGALQVLPCQKKACTNTHINWHCSLSRNCLNRTPMLDNQQKPVTQCNSLAQIERHTQRMYGADATHAHDYDHNAPQTFISMHQTSRHMQVNVAEYEKNRKTMNNATC